MAKKPTPSRATPTPAAEILVAGQRLRGGGQVLEAGAELTAEKAAAMKLTEADIAALTASGALVPATVRVSEEGEGAALADAQARAKELEQQVQAEKKRADEAEGALAALQAEIDKAQGAGKQSQPAA